MSAAAKIGVFMVVVLVILGYFILKIEDIRVDRGAGTKNVQVVFDSVAGLDKKSPVRVAGVRVGKVEDIELTPEGKALVTLQVDKAVQLHPGATARIANLGLLGEQYVELIPGDVNRPPLPEGEGAQVTLRGSQPASFDQVTDQVSAIADDVKSITASLRQAIGGQEGERRMVEIVENVRQITEQVRMLIAANQGNINASAENIRAITDTLRAEIPRIAANIDRVAGSMGDTVGENREDVRAIIENLRTLSADLKVTADNLNGITGTVKSGEGTIGKLLYSDEAHEKLVGALASVDSGVTELKNTLGRANRIGLNVGIRSQYLAGYDAGSLDFDSNSRSGVQVQITPNPELNRFYNVELNEDPRGNRKEKIVETVVTSPESGASTTILTHETKVDRGFFISAQAGWHLDPFDLRLGLFDSSGGVGADWRVADRLSVTGEAFDFGTKYDDNPHLRVYGEYIFRKEKRNSPQLFVTTGVDDFLNDTAFTIGGGIRWKDEDLKYLLGSVPLK